MVRLTSYSIVDGGLTLTFSGSRVIMAGFLNDFFHVSFLRARHAAVNCNRAINRYYTHIAPIVRSLGRKKGSICRLRST